MRDTTIWLPNYSIGGDVLQDLEHICMKYGKRVLIVGGKTALEKATPKIKKSFKDSELEIIDFMWYGGECTYTNIEMVANKCRVDKVDMIIGVGGGKALDTVKGAGYKQNIPVFTVPTIASTCAAITSLSVVYTDKGDFDSFYFFEKSPMHIFIDSEIITNAPAKYLRAGMGDTIAKHYECTLASRGDQLNHSSGMGIEISKMCVKPILEYGEKALEHCEKNIDSFDVKQVILNNIVSTGLVSMLVEEKYNGALAHSLFYGLTILEHIEKNHLHGDVVAYGVLVQLAVDENMDELKKLYNFYIKVNLPTCLNDIEVKNDYDYLKEVLRITVNGPDMEYLPYKINEEMVFKAINEIEKINKNSNI